METNTDQPYNSSHNYTTPPPGPSFWEANKILIKGILIGALILLMMIPAGIIRSLVHERESRQQEVIDEVNSKWANEQTIRGPLLYIPYYERSFKEDKYVVTKTNLIILPELLEINGELKPEIRHRSIYDVMLYRSDLKLTGRFNLNALKKLDLDTNNIIWSEVKLVVGINDSRGLEEEAKLNWNGKTEMLEISSTPGIEINAGLGAPISFSMGLDTEYPFQIDLKLKGSSLLYFTPVGKTTKVNLASTWKNPAFDGKYLPTEPAEISDDGFKATWNVLHVSRDYPQYWTGQNNYSLYHSAFGVKLLHPTDGYAKTQRSVKYALLFIALTFTVFFFMEILQKRQIHPLQYLLVGMALCVFYFLLLSLTEYLGFNPAYVISAFATISLIGMYTWSIFKAGKVALGFIFALSGLYFYIFIIIQLQDFSLLVGSIGLFMILAVIMYYSRKIDWYRVGIKSE